jgi:hypothetical protein
MEKRLIWKRATSGTGSRSMKETSLGMKDRQSRRGREMEERQSFLPHGDAMGDGRGY